MATPTERLPWLAEQPSGAPVEPARTRRSGVMWPWYFLLLLLIAGVGAGAWWLSTGKDAPAPVLPTEESLPIPVTRQEPATTAQPAAADELTNALAPAEAPPPTAAPARPSPARADARTQPQPSPRVRDAARSTRRIFPADESVDAAPAATSPSPVVVYHPQPDRGRVVQLGAFATRAQAESSWRRITRIYPYLATKPKMINTVDVRGLGGGRPTRMYRLQFGTSSQAQSVVICQQLERAGHSCVVVY